MPIETPSDRNYACFFCVEGSEKDPQGTCEACGQPIAIGPLLTGLDVSGYRLEEFVSRGYYGATFRATNRIGKQFALKLVPVALYELHDKSFVEEIAKYGRLGHHPNIAELFDAGEVTLEIAGLPIAFHFIVMEWIDGTTLGAFVAEVPISAAMLFGAALDLTSALSRFEEQNLWHNDLNSENVLVSRVSKEELQTRRAESEFTIKIVDTGSAVFRRAFGHKQVDDLSFLGRHINTLREAASRNSELSREDRGFLSSLVPLVARMLDEDPARRFHSYADIGREIAQLYQAKIGEIAPDAVRLSSPFDYLNANDFPSPAYVNALFSSRFPWIADITNPVAQSLLITGPRGSGKTMILRSMRLRTRLEGCNDQPEALRFRAAVRESGYLAFFTSARLEIGNHILTTKLPKWAEREEVIIAYFHLLYLFEICETLLYATFNCGLDIELGADAHFLRLLEGALDRRIVSLASALEAIRATQADIIDNGSAVTICAPLADGAFLSRVCNALSRIHPATRQKPIVFLLDDFSLPKIPREIQKVLLPIIWNSGGGYTFRVSAHSESIEYRDNRDVVYQASRDFREISLGAEYINSLGEERGRALVDECVSEIFTKRAGLSGDNAVDIKLVVGHAEKRDIAREIQERAKDKSLHRIQYFGWETLLNLCSGDVSYIIDVVGQMMLGRGTGESISPGEQTKIIRNYARRELIRLQDHSGEEISLYEIALNFGKMSLFKLKGQEVSDGDGRRPAEYLRIDVDLGRHSELSQSYIAELLRNGVFIDGGISASSGGNPARRLVFRKLFTPAFPTTYKNKDGFSWRAARFVEFVQNPPAKLREIMGEAGLPPENQQLELDQLYNPEM